MIIDNYTNDAEKIYSTALILFDSFYNDEMIRLVGVSLNNVIQESSITKQISLFESEKEETKDQTKDLLKDLNSNFKNIQFIKASDLLNKKPVQKKYLENNE